MKRITAAFALYSIAAVLSCGKAFPQDRAVQATVPFDFTVGSKLLPPGTYTISPVSDDVISIRNRDANISILSEASTDSKEAAKGELVFDRYAGQYFLREVRCESSALNVDLPATKAEKRARTQDKMNAMVQSETQVEVATK